MCVDVAMNVALLCAAETPAERFLRDVLLIPEFSQSAFMDEFFEFSPMSFDPRYGPKHKEGFVVRNGIIVQATLTTVTHPPGG